MISAVVPLSAELVESMKAAGVWTPSCPVPVERLVLVRTSYFDFDGCEHDDGEIVVLDAVGKYTAQFFARLHALRFPIAKIRSVHYYSNDGESMADNNTSCFWDRPIEGTTLPSLHSYGLAIDLNPLQNPFIEFDGERGTAAIHPAEGWSFVNRRNRKPGMVDDLIELAAEHGFFVWGGSWTTPIDYHHFQPQRGFAELMAAMTTGDGERVIGEGISQRARLKSLQSFPSQENLNPLLAIYRENPDEFFRRWTEFIVDS